MLLKNSGAVALGDIVGKGGNFLLNVGPQPNGELPAVAVARMREIGAWMEVNGEAIYGTRPVAPYKEGQVVFTRFFARSTQRPRPSLPQTPRR